MDILYEELYAHGASGAIASIIKKSETIPLTTVHFLYFANAYLQGFFDSSQCLADLLEEFNPKSVSRVCPGAHTVDRER